MSLGNEFFWVYTWRLPIEECAPGGLSSCGTLSSLGSLSAAMGYRPRGEADKPRTSLGWRCEARFDMQCGGSERLCLGESTKTVLCEC